MVWRRRNSNNVENDDHKMDDAKDAKTTTELLTEAPVDELLLAKREAEEAGKLKAAGKDVFDAE